MLVIDPNDNLGDRYEGPLGIEGDDTEFLQGYVGFRYEPPPTLLAEGNTSDCGEDPHGRAEGGPTPLSGCNCLGCRMGDPWGDPQWFAKAIAEKQPPMNGQPLVSFMAPVAEWLRYWFAKLFLWGLEGCMFALAFRCFGLL